MDTVLKYTLILFVVVSMSWKTSMAEKNMGLEESPKRDTIFIPGVSIVRHIPVQGSPVISSEMDSVAMVLVKGRDLAELLAFQPAVFIKSAGRGALSTASFRGTGASHTAVYWNGIKLNSPMLGQVDLSLLPVWIMDELSILYGGSSLSQGSGALGGSVLLENTTDWNEAFRIDVNQEIASFGTLGTYGRISGGDDRIRSETRVYTMSSENNYTYLNTDIIPAEQQELGQASFSKSGILQELYLRPADRNELALRLWYQQADRELPPLMSQEGAAREERQEDSDLRTSLEFNHYRSFGTFRLRSAWSCGDLQYNLYHNDMGYRQFDSKSRENSLYNTFEADLLAGERTRIQVSGNYNRHDAGINDLVRNAGYQHARNEVGLMAAAYREFGERWVLYALLRQEWADGSFLPLMPSTGFTLRIDPGASLFLKGNLSRNYHLPTLNDLYWVPGGNPDLRPENSVNADLSLEYSFSRRGLTLSGIANAYVAHVKDWILWKPTRFRYWEAENIAEVLSRGVDFQLGAEYKLSKWQLSLRASHAITRSTNESSLATNDAGRGGQLIYIPVHASHAYLNLGRNSWFLNWSLSHTGRRYTQPGSEIHSYSESLAPYLLNDLHFGKRWNLGRGNVGFRFIIYNLFDTAYQSVRSRPMPGRNYAMSLNLGI